MNENEQTKKHSKKKWLIIAALVAIVAVAIAGIGIWAYLTDQESVSNVFTVGKVDITLTEPSFSENNAKNITAKSKIAKDPTVKNVGANDAYVYLKVKVPKVTLKDGDTTKVPLFTYQVNAGWSELTEKAVDADSYIEKVYYYNQNDGVLAVNSETPALFNEVQVANITSDTTYTTVEGETKRLAEDTNYKLEQAIDINAYAIQVNNLPQGRQTVQKAYDVVLGNEYDAGYFATRYPGYKYKTTGNYEFYINGAIETGNTMYRNTDQWWWFASPSAYDFDTVCGVDSYYGYLNRRYLNISGGICPVVCLKSGVQLEPVD